MTSVMHSTEKDTPSVAEMEAALSAAGVLRVLHGGSITNGKGDTREKEVV